MWGLIIGACIAVVAVGLLIQGTISQKYFFGVLMVALVAGLAVGFHSKIKKLKVGLTGAELEAFQEKATEITDQALDKINNRVALQEEALSSVIKKADDTRHDLLKVAEAAAPPLLSFASKEIQRTDEGYELIVRLTPSKNAPFGTVMVNAEIIGDSQATITDFGPKGLTFSSHDLKSPDGKKAGKQYVPVGAQEQTLRLLVSAPCKARISCSHMREPLEIEIK